MLFFAWAGPAFGQLGALIYSQAPNRNFAYLSDTQYVNDLGHADGVLRADRFQLTQAAQIGQLVWWGVYGPQFGPIQNPPFAESFRVRFYDQNGTFPSLPPFDVLYEATLSNSVREETGVLISSGFPEYRFVVDLSSTFAAPANVPLWIEISQVGDLASTWRWETASGGEFATQYPIGDSWNVNGGGQLAYQLRVPEPGSGVLVGLVAMVMRWRRIRGWGYR